MKKVFDIVFVSAMSVIFLAANYFLLLIILTIGA